MFQRNINQKRSKLGFNRTLITKNFRFDKCAIFITRGPACAGDYDYQDEVLKSFDSHVIAWHGQRKGRKDKYVGIGTGVFYRTNVNKPFMWLGRIGHKELLDSGEPWNSKPAVYLLNVPMDENTFKKFEPQEQGNGCYKKAAQKGMGYPVSTSFLSGIIYHS